MVSKPEQENTYQVISITCLPAANKHTWTAYTQVEIQCQWKDGTGDGRRRKSYGGRSRIRDTLYVVSREAEGMTSYGGAIDVQAEPENIGRDVLVLA